MILKGTANWFRTIQAFQRPSPEPQPRQNPVANMKLISILLVSPLSVLALPGTSPNGASPAAFDTNAAAARTCYLHNEALDQDVGCDQDPNTARRVRRVRGGDRPVVTCIATGRKVTWKFASGTTTSDRWDYVDSWGCWIWAGFTQIGCESELHLLICWGGHAANVIWVQTV